MSERSGKTPEVDLRKMVFEPSEAPDSILRLLSSDAKNGDVAEPVNKYSRPIQVGFNASLLDKGPTLSDLVEEERFKTRGDNKKRVGFLDVLNTPERDARTWLIAFWREPAVMFLFDHQNNFLVDDEIKKLGLDGLNVVEIVRMVNVKFKEILKKMGVEAVNNPFNLVSDEDGWSVRIEVKTEELDKMETAIVASEDFAEEEKGQLVNFIDSHLKKN